MKTDTLRDQVKTYYQNQNMSPDKVQRLASMLRAAGHQSAIAGKPSVWRRLAEWLTPANKALVPAAVTGLMFMIMLNVGVWYHWQGSSESTIKASIAREILMNHLKDLNPEYQAASIERLGKIMPSLDFNPVSPKRLSDLGLVLKGARYCSIQGHLAMQIKLYDSAGLRHTIYEAPILPPLEKLRGTELSLNDVRITMWRENGIFVGLASPKSEIN